MHSCVQCLRTEQAVTLADGNLFVSTPSSSQAQQSQLKLYYFHTLQVREVELGMDMPSVLRLLDFLEALFNGGSDFNEPLRRCLNRLTDAKWANSDILLVSGEGRV